MLSSFCNPLPGLPALRILAAFTLCALVPLGAVAGDESTARVKVVKTPNGGIQPQAVFDSKGVLHLLYFKGDAAGGDLFYVRRQPGEEDFSRPIRVNSQAGSAIAVGTIRGGQMAVGKKDRIHVVWNGSGKARPQGPERSSPMLYSRLNSDGTAFEAQRNLMQAGKFLDGGGSVAADQTGNVYVAWQAAPLEGAAGEATRTVWLARSSDDGKTFSAETSILPRPTGACACCGMRAFADRKNNLYLFYRAAMEGTHRPMILLVSRNQGEQFREALAHPWEINACPMSSQVFVESKDKVLVGWDTEGQVYFTLVDPATGKASPPQAASGESRSRKHPALAVNPKGEILFAWTEGTGWQQGGSLAWEIRTAAGRPTREHGRVEGGIPVWGLPAAVAAPDGSFVIFH